jgi:ankyrin repeat protein
MKYLIKNLGFDINEHFFKSGTPLMLAAWNNQINIVESLLEEGADVNLASYVEFEFH